MATLRASWLSSAAVATTSRSARPIRVAMPVQSLSLTPVRIRAHIRCQKGADNYPTPEPEPEPEQEPELDDYHPDVVSRKHHTSDVIRSYARATQLREFVDLIPANSENPCMQELRKYHEAYCAATGMRIAPDMFPDEKDTISKYMLKISSSRVAIQNVNNKVMALTVCAQAQTALDLASMVMDLTDIASLDVGMAEFSQHTLNQMVRTYTPIFSNAAEDAYRKRIKRDTILSFLDALRGVVAICHVLVQDTVAMLEYCHPSRKRITEEMVKPSHEYDRKAKNLKQEFQTATLDHEVVMEILFDGIKQAQLHIFQLIQYRAAALGFLLLEKARKLQEAENAERLQEAENAKRLRDTGFSS